MEASIVLRKKENAITIPASYVVGGSAVLISEDERRPVELGARDLERVEVLSGIDSTTVLYKPEACGCCSTFPSHCPGPS